ncbi:MAG: FGGY-family carbohydrate kinase [Geminicoccaceae bacterium]
MDPVVVGIDSSTQSTKAIAFDRQGRSVAEGRGQVPLSNPTLYWFEQEPEHWWSSTAEALGQLTDKVDAGAIEAISISNQRETIGFLNANGEPTRPAMVWLDERARAEVETADEAFGAERIHQITGRPVDLTPCLYRLRWLAKHEPQIFEQTQKFVDVNAYLTKRLTGRLACGWFACDPMGYFDLAEKNWSAPLLEWLEIDETRLPEFEAPGDLLGEVTEEAASATGLKPGTPVFAGGGDGQCAALGTNCTASDQAYLNLGTAVVGGIWSAAYKNARA